MAPRQPVPRGTVTKLLQVEEKALIRRYTGLSNDDIAYCFIGEALKSCAHTAIIAMQVGG